MVPQLYGGREKTEATYSPCMGESGPPAGRGGHHYQDAVREVLAANAELPVLARKERQKRRR
jgi:hypothetical protein